MLRGVMFRGVFGVLFLVAFCWGFNISYSPYGIDTRPDGGQPELGDMVRDFEIMSLNFGSLIFYGLDEYPFYVVDSLAEFYGMDYWAGAYCGGYTSRWSRLSQVRSYLDRVDSLGHIGLRGLVYGYNTGNLGEILEEMGTISSEYPDVVLTHLEYVDVVKREGWFYSDSLVDIVPVCVFPDQDIRAEDLEGDPGLALDYVRDQYDLICSLYPEKRVVLFEVGVSTYNLSEVVQSEILSSILSWVEGDSIDSYLFEFRDQYWKSYRDKRYGLFDEGMGAKQFAREHLTFPHERISLPLWSGDSSRVFACEYSDVFSTRSREGSVIWSANVDDIKRASEYADYLLLEGADEFSMCDSFISAGIPYGLVFGSDTVLDSSYFEYVSNAGLILFDYSRFSRHAEQFNLLELVRYLAPGVPVGLESSYAFSNMLPHMTKFSPYFDFFVIRHSSPDDYSIVADSFSLVDTIPLIPSYTGNTKGTLGTGSRFIYSGIMSTFIQGMDAVSVSSHRALFPVSLVPVERVRPEYYSVTGRRVSGGFNRGLPSSILIRRDRGQVRRVLQVR